MKNIFAQRLKNARIIKGWSQDEMASKIGLTKQAISKYEKGLMMPNSSVLIALSNIFDTSIDYFFRPLIVSINNIEFRKKANTPKKNIETIKHVILDKLERYIEIENICDENTTFNTNMSHIVVSSKDDVYRVAEELKKEWQLGEDGISNVIEILEEHQIKVIEVDGLEKLDGVSGRDNFNNPIIAININITPERKRFSALHELGHIVMNFDESISAKEKEALCNTFANEMLISKEIFIQKIDANRKGITVYELQSIQAQYGISIDALMYKAKELNIISDNRYKNYWIKKNMSSEFKDDVEKSIYGNEKSNRFEFLVYKALAKEIISISKAEYFLNIPQANISSQLNFI